MNSLIKVWVRLTSSYRKMNGNPSLADYAIVVPGVALAAGALAVVTWASLELIGDHVGSIGDAVSRITALR